MIALFVDHPSGDQHQEGNPLPVVLPEERDTGWSVRPRDWSGNSVHRGGKKKSTAPLQGSYPPWQHPEQQAESGAGPGGGKWGAHLKHKM